MRLLATMSRAAAVRRQSKCYWRHSFATGRPSSFYSPVVRTWRGCTGRPWPVRQLRASAAPLANIPARQRHAVRPAPATGRSQPNWSSGGHRAISERDRVVLANRQQRRLNRSTADQTVRHIADSRSRTTSHPARASSIESSDFSESLQVTSGSGRDGLCASMRYQLTVIGLRQVKTHVPFRHQRVRRHIRFKTE
jgi:hypothetical protein